MVDYENLTVDGGLAREVGRLFEQHQGLWPSKRALYHELLRRGLMSLSAAPAPVAVTPPSPPPAPAVSPSAGQEVQPGPEVPSVPRRRARKDPSPEASPPSPASPRGGRSPSPAVAEPESTKAAVGGEAQGAGSPSPAPVEVSTWTCPRCRQTMPLSERVWHKPDCPGRPSEPSSTARPMTSTPTPSGSGEGPHGGMNDGGSREQQGVASPAVHEPAARQPDVDRMVRFVKMFVHGAREQPGDRTAYLAAAVQAAHRDQGLPEPSEQEAREIVRALANRDPSIEHVLEAVA